MNKTIYDQAVRKMKVNKLKLNYAIRVIKINADANKRALDSAIDFGYTDDEIDYFLNKAYVYDFVIKLLDDIYE